MLTWLFATFFVPMSFSWQCHSPVVIGVLVLQPSFVTDRCSCQCMSHICYPPVTSYLPKDLWPSFVAGHRSRQCISHVCHPAITASLPMFSVRWCWCNHPSTIATVLWSLVQPSSGYNSYLLASIHCKPSLLTTANFHLACSISCQAQSILFLIWSYLLLHGNTSYPNSRFLKFLPWVLGGGGGGDVRDICLGSFY